MNSQQFNKINISINGTNILCENAILSQESSQKPAYAINNTASFDYTPSTIKNTLNITYFSEIPNEPNYNIISGLKVGNFIGNPLAILNLGNIQFTGYLSKLSFTVAPLQTIQAKASYEIFTPVTGNFIQGNQSDGNLYNLTNSSGLSNYFSAYLYSGANIILNSNILQFDYNFNCTVVPIYSLGNPYPVQVYISEGNETIDTISEIQNNIQFSGLNLINLLGVDSIRLTNQSSEWGDNLNQIIYYVSGMKNNTSKIEISTNNLILFNNQFSQSF